MKDYTKFMKWAVVTMIDRNTQDDRKSKVSVSALFESLIVAEDFYIPNLPINGVYNYNAMIFRSVDGGKTFFHCGYGKYCKTIEEAEAYKNEIETV